MSKQSPEAWKKRIAEFRDKKLVDGSEAESLIGMISSSDKENFHLVVSIAKVFIKEALSKTLNPGQKEAFDKIVEYIDNGQEDAFVLKGYAGTGKTYLIKQVIEYIIQTEEHSKLALTAPTNKAVKVLYNNSANNNTSSKGYLFEDLFDSNSRIVYSTIHKLLALKEIVSDSGAVTFETSEFGSIELSDYQYLFVDEVSMLDDKLTNIVLSKKKLKVIFLGDPCQIPQIGKGECIPFNSITQPYVFKYAELNEIMRQKGDNAIIAQSFIIRNNLHSQDPLPSRESALNDKQEGIIVLDSIADKSRIRSLFREYIDTPQFRANPDYFKVIAWRNETIRYVNGVIREVLYGTNAPTFVVGEKLITQKPVFERVIIKKRRGSIDGWRVAVPNSEELVLENITEDYIVMKESASMDTFKAYELTVSYTDFIKGELVKKKIKVVHEEDKAKFTEYLEQLKGVAVKGKKAFLWVRYFNALKYTADINYNYTLSIHKSQGSTYQNVLLLEEDVNKNPNVVERNRIKYTAYTRAAKRLYVLKKGELSKQPYRDYRTKDYTSTGPT